MKFNVANFITYIPILFTQGEGNWGGRGYLKALHLRFVCGLRF